jgi:CubicO group peptidase (beta-lactamase class C family)
MLLTHGVGLSWPQSYDGEQGMWNQFEPDQAPSPSEWIPQFLISSGDNYDANLWKPIEPGCCEFYTNISFCIVAYLVEHISKEDFRDYCRRHIFIPLNMSNTSYDYADLDQENIAVLYDQQNRPTYYFDNRVYAAGGAKSTIRDLGRFASIYMNKGLLHGERILEGNTIDKILEIQNQASGRCLAWKKSLGDWFGHAGGLLLGAAATLDIHPQSKTATIVLTNTHSNLVIPGGEIFGFVRNKANEYNE